MVDGSTDGTRALLAGYRSPYRLRVVEQPNGGQCSALNRGVAEAAGEFCLLLDDDIIAGPALVAEHLAAQRRRRRRARGRSPGAQVPAHADWYVRQVRDGWARHYARLDAGQASLKVADCYSGNLCLPRAAFLGVGGFAEDFRRGYDTELAFRLVQSGLPLVYVPRAGAAHHDAKTSRELLRDLEREAANSVAIYRRHPAALAAVSLDRFPEDGPTEVTLRRLLLALNCPWAPSASSGRSSAAWVGEAGGPAWFGTTCSGAGSAPRSRTTMPGGVSRAASLSCSITR